MVLSTHVPVPALLPSGNHYSVLCIYVFSLIVEYKKQTINEQSKQNKNQQKEILTCVDCFILSLEKLECT